MKKCGKNTHKRKNFQWKDDFFHQVTFVQHKGWRLVQHLGEKTMHHKAYEQYKRKLNLALIIASTPPRFECDGKNKSVNDKHEHGIKKRPSHPEE